MSIENISLRQQVRESIKANSVVRVDATGCNITDIMAQLSVMSGVDADRSREDDGTWDVYGTADGDEFHLCVTCNNGMSRFTYATDSGSGTVEAESLDDAYQALRSKITDAQVDDGATLWVEDSATGERMTMGKDGAL